MYRKPVQANVLSIQAKIRNLNELMKKKGLSAKKIDKLDMEIFSLEKIVKGNRYER